MSLQFESTRVGPDITIVRLLGSLVAGPEGHALESVVLDLAGRGEKKLIFDLCGIDRIDSAGVQFVLQCFFTLRQAEGELRLASANPKVARLLSVTRLDALVPCYRTVTAASASFKLERGA